LAADQLWGRLEFNRHSSGVDVKPPGWPGPLLNEKILQSSLPVILQGETGTGKSHLAEEIHKRSGRQGQFVSLNLASLSSGLIESELFGHQRGSFTGAIRDHRGAFALARGGTIFLDEIDSISRDIQVKLLTFLDHGYFRPIGAERSERSDARVIVASGQKLVDLVRKELFRKDLFYRLSQGVLCQLLPLRDQPELIKRHCLIFSLEKNVIISERLIDFYKTLPWPGNVRQLRGHLDLKAIKSRTKKIDFDDSDDALLAMSSDLTFFQEFASVKPMEEMKRDYAQRVYLMLNQNLVRTAKELKVNVKTLKNWISEKECG
jgi:transcriptional regulator with PAS, ATPase and Fis domain